eukprot:TRINITY_DN44454_c0_g1_i1.p1 TRINITY_DN44454_c0_g1~~TRINITY_DN44454_c0_g1_i1.p1  ORF type:complete len:267 (+),score=78.59 TRINITY_DN44454_c0_g1_i1:45-803(+)
MPAPGLGWDGSPMRDDGAATRRSSYAASMPQFPRGDTHDDPLGGVEEDRGKFYVVVNGTVEGCLSQGARFLYSKFRFERGRDWDVLRLSSDTESLQEGVTQVAEMMGGSVPFFAWNMPFSVAFASTNPYGWPKLVLSVYDVDSNERPTKPWGYGWCHVPTQPGRYEIDVPLFRPVAASPQARFVAFLRGFSFGFRELPEFRSGAVWASGEHREVTTVQAAEGSVRVVMHVLTKNMALHGFSQTGTSSQPHRR